MADNEMQEQPPKERYRRISLTLHNRCLAACQSGDRTAEEIALLTHVARGWHLETNVTKADYETALALLPKRVREG